MVSSGDVRKKLYNGEKMKVMYGDVVELIPGHHYFKYLEIRGVAEADVVGLTERNVSRKRLRQIADDESLARALQVLLYVSYIVCIIFLEYINLLRRQKMS